LTVLPAFASSPVPTFRSSYCSPDLVFTAFPFGSLASFAGLPALAGLSSACAGAPAVSTSQLAHTNIETIRIARDSITASTPAPAGEARDTCYNRVGYDARVFAADPFIDGERAADRFRERQEGDHQALSAASSGRRAGAGRVTGHSDRSPTAGRGARCGSAGAALVRVTHGGRRRAWRPTAGTRRDDG